MAVLKVVSSKLSVTAAAAEVGISRGHLHRLLRRYRDGGLDDLGPRSRRPHSSPHGTSDEVRDRIVVQGRSIVAARLTPAAYSNGLALALPQVVMARPEVSEFTT